MSNMTFDFDQELKDQVKQIVENDPVEYPSIGNFINKSVRDKIQQIKQGGSNGQNSETTK